MKGRDLNETLSQSYGVSLLRYGITQCYLPPTVVNTPRLNPSQTGRYSIDLPGGFYYKFFIHSFIFIWIRQHGP